MLGTVHAFRGYALGLTELGVANAVVVPLGAHGLPIALAMLALVLLANNTIQNVLEPFAFGRSLRLHPWWCSSPPPPAPCSSG